MRQRGGGRVSLHPNLRSPCGHLNWIRLDFYLGSDLIDWVLNHFSPKGDSSAVTSFQSEIQNPKVSEPGNRIQQRGGIYRLHRIFFFLLTEIGLLLTHFLYLASLKTWCREETPASKPQKKLSEEQIQLQHLRVCWSTISFIYSTAWRVKLSTPRILNKVNIWL